MGRGGASYGNSFKTRDAWSRHSSEWMQVMLVIGSGWWWYLNLEITSAAARSRSRFPQGATRGFLRGIPMVDKMPWKPSEILRWASPTPCPLSTFWAGTWPTQMAYVNSMPSASLPLSHFWESKLPNHTFQPCSALMSFQSLEFWPVEFCSSYTQYTSSSTAVFHTQCFFLQSRTNYWTEFYAAYLCTFYHKCTVFKFSLLSLFCNVWLLWYRLLTILFGL